MPGYISKTDVKEELKRVKKQAEDAVADYLTKLFEHTEEVLLRRYGQTFISTTRLDVVLTVPAVWSDAAQDATLRAAEKAGSSVGRKSVNASLLREVVVVARSKKNFKFAEIELRRTLKNLGLRTEGTANFSVVRFSVLSDLETYKRHL